MSQEPRPTESGDSRSAAGDRWHATPLSREALAVLQQSLVRQQHRRHRFRAGPLRVCLDGAERWQVDPRLSVCEPFRVPLRASSLDVVGDEADGALLLAVCPLPEPDAMQADGVQHLSVSLEGGQTVALDIALTNGSDGEAQAYVLQLAYAEPPAVKALLPKPRPGAIHDGGAGEAHRPPA